ncbi:hypothetical protein [Lysinibacillus fusiformis]|uniref:Uncharacterized protein n=1 Tax=Lysinibacillus fusiformis TaxID=28031 RepID=A0A1E4QYI2_9BACI|nr:hypothetical protein [Lysinibacillus fusiformis]ODV53273.1 hypothetical protein BG258_23515 [Lysinibacillus fusiformis]
MINTYHTIVTVIGTAEDIEQFKVKHLDDNNNIKLEVAAPLEGKDPIEVWGAPSCTTEHYEDEDGTCVNVCIGSRGLIDHWFKKFSTDNPQFETHLNYTCLLLNEKGTLIYKDGEMVLEIA